MTLRIHISIHEADLMPVAYAISKVDELHLVEPETSANGRWRRLTETLADQDDRFGKVCKALGIESEEGEPSGPGDPEADAEEAGHLLDEIDRKLEGWRKTHDKVEEERRRFQAYAEAHKRLDALGLSVSEIRKTRYLELRFGWMPADQQGRMACPALRHPLVLIPMGKEKERILIGAATIKKNGYVLQRVLNSLFFEPLCLGEEVTPEALNHPEKRMKDLESRILRNDGARDRFADEWRGRIIALRDRIQGDLKAVRLIHKYGGATREGFYSLSGELPEEQRDFVFRTIRKKAGRPHAIFAGKSMERASA